MNSLEGLTPRQKAIADLLWNTTTLEEVNALERTLGKDVVLVKELIIAESLDEYMEVSPFVKNFLEKL